LVFFLFTPLYLVMVLITEAYLESLYSVLIPIFVSVVAFFLFKVKVSDLSDEVLDYGDYLLFRKGKTTQLIHFDEIISVYSERGSPERIIINLRTEGNIGKKLVFTPPSRLHQYTENPIAVELIARVEKSRAT
ncbi:hypothetical protein LRP52_49955, partial [Photobacterium sp. ZSDE20]|nr:hypothetical protein [Photobacterium sp. ZSDE20]